MIQVPNYYNNSKVKKKTSTIHEKEISSTTDCKHRNSTYAKVDMYKDSFMSS